VTGYPELAQKYRVSSVPKTVVDETVEFVGAGPESMLLKHVQQAAAANSSLIVCSSGPGLSAARGPAPGASSTSTRSGG
jgi:hypothetical protein